VSKEKVVVKVNGCIEVRKKRKKNTDTFLECERNRGCEKKKQRWADGVHKIIVEV